MKRNHWAVFAFFVLLVVVLRFSSFFESVIDSDESLYLLMAQSWLNGQPPYTEIWDNKPLGIYILFSIALILFGKFYISIRILACIAIISTSYLLYRVGNTIGKNGIGLLAGTLYVFNSLENGGMASNTEIFFTPFVTLAFYLLIYKRISPIRLPVQINLRLLAIGLLLGIGFEIKYVVIFEFITVLLIVGTSLYLQKNNSKYFSILQSYIWLSLGFILPLSLISLYFVFNGHFDNYFYANFIANKVRTIDNAFSFAALRQAIFNQVKDNLLLWSCLLLTPLYLSLNRGIDSEERRKITVCIAWFFGALLGICYVFRGEFWPHYFLQLTPSLCLISSYLIIRLIFNHKNIASANQYFLLIIIFLVPLLHYANSFKHSAKIIYFRQVKGINNWGDNPAAIGEYIKERIDRNDYIYVVDYEPIIYFLSQAKIPTRYAYPAFLVGNISKLTGIDPIQELNHIIMQKKPIYVIQEQDHSDFFYTKHQDLFYAELNEYLRKYYLLEKSYPQGSSNAIKVYKLKHNIN